MSRARKKKPLTSAPDYTGRASWECVLTAPVLRELRVSTLVGAPVDPDKFIHVIETLEEILDGAQEAQISPRHGLVNANLAAEEVPGVIIELRSASTDAADEVEKAEKQFDDRYDDAQKEAANAAAEHATIVADHCKEIDELRKRVELAEHREKVLGDACLGLERMLELLRAEKPMKVRGAKS